MHAFKRHKTSTCHRRHRSKGRRKLPCHTRWRALVLCSAKRMLKLLNSMLPDVPGGALFESVPPSNSAHVRGRTVLLCAPQGRRTVRPCAFLPSALHHHARRVHYTRSAFAMGSARLTISNGARPSTATDVCGHESVIQTCFHPNEPSSFSGSKRSYDDFGNTPCVT